MVVKHGRGVVRERPHGHVRRGEHVTYSENKKLDARDSFKFDAKVVH